MATRKPPIITSEAEARVAVTILSKAPNVESRGNAPLIDSESSSVVSEAEVMLDRETRQNIIREDDTNEKLILGEEGRVLDIDSSNFEHQSHYWYMFHHELEVETHQKIVEEDIPNRKPTFYGGWPIGKPPDVFLPNLEQPLKEDAIYTKLARLNKAGMLELTYKAPGDGLAIENTADAEGVASSAAQQKVLLVVPEPVPIIENVVESSSSGPPARFRRIYVASAANDLDGMSYQYIGKTRIWRTYHQQVDLASKHPSALIPMNGCLIAIVAVGLLCGCEDEDFVDCVIT
ncbi:hypothetical protein JOM56_014833 [Amanita muscaria]